MIRKGARPRTMIDYVTRRTAKREEAIRKISKRILPWINAEIKGPVKFEAVAQHFPHLPRERIGDALRLLESTGKIKYTRHRVLVTETRRRKLAEYVRASRNQKTPRELLKVLQKEYSVFSDPLAVLRTDIRTLDEKTREKILPERTRESLAKGVEEAIEQDPKLTNTELAEKLGVSKRSIEDALPLVPEPVIKKRIIGRYSAEQRDAQNKIIQRGIRRGYTTRNILIEINRLPGRQMSLANLRQRINSVTGLTVPEIEQQNGIIMEVLLDMKEWALKNIVLKGVVPENYVKSIKQSLTAAGLSLDDNEIVGRFLGIGSRLKR